ncbi:hypothetical protein NE237_001006 [Protea cynaroides]|uniref:Uncharacterized protein n=1 Tax=Protea cynaroides TaxID=273540 RepID=A0A9Q0QY14_9MAGN|nr:hypothetical protein NE237_001006 [Protea cynaroides]
MSPHNQPSKKKHKTQEKSCKRYQVMGKVQKIKLGLTAHRRRVRSNNPGLEYPRVRMITSEFEEENKRDEEDQEQGEWYFHWSQRSNEEQGRTKRKKQNNLARTREKEKVERELPGKERIESGRREKRSSSSHTGTGHTGTHKHYFLPYSITIIFKEENKKLQMKTNSLIPY